MNIKEKQKETLSIICMYSNCDMLVTRYSPRKFTVIQMLPELIQEIEDSDDEYPFKHMDKYKLILRPLSDMTDKERKELWKLVFNREFIGNNISFIDKTTVLQHTRWVMSSGVERLGILLNGEVWYDSDLQTYKFNQHLITLFYLKQGFDLFGLIDSGQAIDKTKI